MFEFQAYVRPLKAKWATSERMSPASGAVLWTWAWFAALRTSGDNLSVRAVWAVAQVKVRQAAMVSAYGKFMSVAGWFVLQKKQNSRDWHAMQEKRAAANGLLRLFRVFGDPVAVTFLCRGWSVSC